MRRTVILLAGIVVGMNGNTVRAQGTKSPAELLPAKTMAYIELRQPGALAKEIAGLLEGSYLSNVPESLAPLKAKAPPRRRGPDELALIGLMLAPELMKEIGRIWAAALAITGIDKENPHMPEFVVLIQPGDSNAPGFMMRMFMTLMSRGSYSSSGGKTRTEMSASFERVAEVEGVGLYRDVSRRWQIPEKGPRPEPEVRVSGPALAHMDGLLLVGSPDLVKQVIRRAKGKGDGPTLASVPIFQKASKDSIAKSGLFIFANPAPIIDMVDNLELGRAEREIVAAVKQLVNPKAFLAVADQLTLENATLRYHRRLYLDAKEKSPLLEILPQGAVPPRLLDFAAPDSAAFVAVANDNGGKRFQKLLDVVDNMFKGGGDRDLPSRAVQGFEEALKLRVGKDILDKIRGAAIAMPSMEKLMSTRGKPQDMVILVEAIDDKAAGLLAENVVPKAFALMARNEDIKATTEKVGGHSLNVLQTKRGYSLHVGRHDSMLAISPHQPAVVEALNRGAKKQGLLSDEKLAARIKAHKDPVVLGMMRPLAATVGWYLLEISSDEPARSTPPSKEPEPKPRREAVKKPKDQDLPKSLKPLLNVLKTEEPLLFTVTRTADHIDLEASYSGLRPLVARLTNFLLEEAFRSRSEGRSAETTPPTESKKD